MRIEVCDSLKSHVLYEELFQSISTFYKDFSVDGAEDTARLVLEDGVVKLSSDLFSTVHCDFTDPGFLKEVKQSFGRSEGVYSFLKPLSKNKKIKICDMTVGMGRDFFKFILAGHDVVGFERNPVFYFLVWDGVDRFLKSEASESLKEQFRVDEFKIDLRLGDATFANEQSFDLIYYDPMFEDKAKKAAPKKGMQALKFLNQPSPEGEKEKCIQSALKINPQKFIFKCAGVKKDFPFEVKKEQKGKGFSYVYL